MSQMLGILKCSLFGLAIFLPASVIIIIFSFCFACCWCDAVSFILWARTRARAPFVCECFSSHFFLSLSLTLYRAHFFFLSIFCWFSLSFSFVQFRLIQIKIGKWKLVSLCTSQIKKRNIAFFKAMGKVANCYWYDV